jgi:hypothetical protein
MKRSKLFLPSDVPNAELYTEWDFNFPAQFGTVIDSSGSPSLFTTIPNMGLLGGTFDAAGAVRPDVSSISSGGVTRRCAEFDNAADYMSSSLGTSSWKFLHDGTGCSLFYVFRPTLGASTGYCITTGSNFQNFHCISLFWEMLRRRTEVHLQITCMSSKPITRPVLLQKQSFG